MDSRFHLKLTFSIYGHDYPWDASLNWSADPGQIDERITEFFLKSYEDAADKNEAKQQRIQAEREKKETEAQELAELKRLKQKYNQ